MKMENLSPSVLVMEKAKDQVCVSVIVPTERSEPRHKESAIRLKKAVEKAKVELNRKYPEDIADHLSDMLTDLHEHSDMHDIKDGIGLYVSDKMKLVRRFEFPVKEKLIIGDSFEIRELMEEEQLETPYLVLSITRKISQLFTGRMKKLEELKDEHFPLLFVDDYEYMHPNPASSYSGRALEKAFEKDKSIVVDLRMERYVHEVDKFLDPYIKPDLPLFVLGEKEDLGYFRKVSRHSKNVQGELKGSYSHLEETQLGELSWPLMQEYLNRMEDQAIAEFIELPPSRKEEGLENSWKAMVEGRGLKLLVEKDFSRPAFLDSYGYILYKDPSPDARKALVDAVDDLVEKAVEMNTHVIFVENDKLRDHERVCLINRF
jgi:hypothetical protein